MAIKVTPGGLRAVLVSRARKNPKNIQKAMKRAANRSMRRLKQRTPVDVGQMKNSWRVSGLDNPEIINDAPHAGIIEGGARPHKVNAAGRQALVRWAMRKLNVDEKTAQAVAAGTIKKLERHGQEGKFIVRDSMDDIRDDLAKEIVKALRRGANKR